MNNVVKKICAGIVLAAAMSPALAAPPASTTRSAGSSVGAIDEGAMEVGGLFAWFKTDTVDIGLAIVNGGYMVTDQLEGKLSWMAFLGDASGGLITPGADWLFTGLHPTVVPYAGGGYSLAYGDADGLDSIDLHAGVKQFLTERIAIDYRFSYLSPTDSAYDSTTIMQVGFTYYL
jgi:hypothetical protein